MTYREAMDRAAREYLVDLLASSESVAAAARSAGLSLPGMHRLCDRLGVARANRRAVNPVTQWLRQPQGIRPR